MVRRTLSRSRTANGYFIVKSAVTGVTTGGIAGEFSADVPQSAGH